MKRKDKETLRNMSLDELRAQGRELDKHLFQVKFRRTSAPVENPLQIRTGRRKAALIKTLIGQKQAAAVKSAEVKK